MKHEMILYALTENNTLMVKLCWKQVILACFTFQLKLLYVKPTDKLMWWNKISQLNSSRWKHSTLFQPLWQTGVKWVIKHGKVWSLAVTVLPDKWREPPTPVGYWGQCKLWLQNEVMCCRTDTRSQVCNPSYNFTTYQMLQGKKNQTLYRMLVLKLWNSMASKQRICKTLKLRHC